MRIIIVRHAEPDYSIDSLTKKGWREADLLAERLSKLDVKACYCSPLGRAQDTSKATLEKLGMTAETLDWLCEFRGQIIDEESGNIRNSWDLKPHYWTSMDELYDREKWLDNDIIKSVNTVEQYKAVCDGIDALLLKHGYRHNGNQSDHYGYERCQHNDNRCRFHHRSCSYHHGCGNYNDNAGSPNHHDHRRHGRHLSHRS
jgi:probable phosphoglycerate mutase